MNKGCIFALIWVLGFVLHGGSGSSSCGFPAIYNFGDSNSDTGGKSAAFTQVPPPNGETFFGAPSGRVCDGRLLIDFIAEKLKLPYLSAYLDSVGSDFHHGANFATAGSSIRPGGYSPFNLGVQISQFIQFKSRTTRLYNRLGSNGKESPLRSILPRPNDFSKALYTFDIGQNDLSYGFQYTTAEQVRVSIPDIINQFSQAIHLLYGEGARFFWVHNTGPIGCLPYSAIFAKEKANLDKNGCVIYQNEMAKEFNWQLKNRLPQLKAQLPEAVFTYVDLYSAKYALISNAKEQGFVEPWNFCCGSFNGRPIGCGKRTTVNGTTYGGSCNHPSMHISWDGIHYTEAANLWIAERSLNGSFSDPPVSILDACKSVKFH